MRYLPTPRKLMRAGTMGLAAGLLGLVGLQGLTAQAISGHNSNAPVDYAADRIELQSQQDRVVLSGNVDVTQNGLRVRADRTIVDFTEGSSLRIQRITATGGVVVTRGDQVARGDVAIYDFNRKIITMVGGASLRSDSESLKGERFVIDLKSGVSAAQGGRVSGSFSAPGGN